MLGGNNLTAALGTANGTLTAARGGKTLSYAFTMCGQSTYPASHLKITAGSATTMQTVSSGQCQQFSGTLTSTTAISSATVVLDGSTFWPGNTYTTYTKTKTVSF